MKIIRCCRFGSLSLSLSLSLQSCVIFSAFLITYNHLGTPCKQRLGYFFSDPSAPGVTFRVSYIYGVPVSPYSYPGFCSFDYREQGGVFSVSLFVVFSTTFTPCRLLRSVGATSV